MPVSDPGMSGSLPKRRPQSAPSSRPSPSTDYEPVWSWARPVLPAECDLDPATDKDRADPASDAETVLIIGCRGVQMGNRNKQYNRYEYRLSTRGIDFATVLRRRPVQDALVKLMLDPDSETLRADVMRELCADRAYLLRRTVIDPGQVERPHAASTDRQDEAVSAPPPLHGFVLVHNCQGVQAGDQCVQHNEFLYPCRRSQINERALVATRPELAEAIVDTIIGRSAVPTPPTVWEELDKALNDTPNPERFGRVVRDFRRTCVEGADGVSYGRDNQATYTSTVTSRMRQSRVEALLKQERSRFARAAIRQARDEANRADRAAIRQGEHEAGRSEPGPTREVEDTTDRSTRAVSRGLRRPTTRPTRAAPQHPLRPNDRPERDTPRRADPPDRSGPSIPGF
ncbi:hypothetical protein OG288_44165 [Streptomyces tauricus]|uniref:Uncharacterized protein n=1 Tax=Streptomyces tauricus TaxID=68274 RepID=A0ABZ1JUQ7_9ACTN|nr:hypothetical protein [Streptomyces tauricus]